jgi:hypothetical protein
VSAPGLNLDPSNSCAVKHDGARPNPLGHADRQLYWDAEVR